MAHKRTLTPMIKNDRIIRLRKEAGMKQVEFAEYFDCELRNEGICRGKGGL